MDLNLIHLFVEIVEARSFTAAAQKLGMTRSNLSNRLKVLERETGAQLLRRSTRSLELTQAGETLFEHGRRMLQEVETARASIDGLGQTVRGHVRVSVPTGLGRFFLGAMLLDFAREHPSVTLRVTFSNRVNDLIASEIDVAFKITSAPPQDTVAREVCPIGWSLFATRDYLKAHGPVATPEALAGQSIVCPPMPGRRLTLALARTVRGKTTQHSVTVEPRMQSEDFPFLADAVARGMAIGLLPNYVTRATATPFERVLPGYEVGGLGAHLVILTLPNRYASPAMRALIDFVRERVTVLASDWR
ncbi:LysR family transcriptional regulator [uncultured Ralstonia sp.]|jgi:DNA-binding transcriptional LysR family regulator|uniref:LysR family transcriptional regulator n=1 Tax=Ralstonia sp. TaxID=54061 RepID=UPI0025ECECC1|nr:LysR family transcriptional regulator [uncultured Ralstonia sp.]